MPLTEKVEVPPRDRDVLASWVRSPSIRAGLAQRARIVLLASASSPPSGSFIDGWNDHCRPFTWTKTADEILPHGEPGKRTSSARR